MKVQKFTRNCHRSGRIIYGLFLTLLILPLSIAAIPVNQDKIELEEAFLRISEKYHAYFNYDRSITMDIEVDYKDDLHHSLDDALSYVLKNTDLGYRIYDERYVVVFQNNDQGIESLKNMIGHMQGLVNERDKRRKKLAIPSLPRLNTLTANELYQKRIIFNVTGTVTDQNGEPLIGVNIQVKGTNKGTSTDLEGRFVLEDIDENAVLLVSYIGYQTQEIMSMGKSSVSIVLIPDSQFIEEVVVVGYGTQKRINLTGAVDHVDGTVLHNRPVTRVSQALQGVVGNLNVFTNTSGGEANAKQDFNIRGYTGFGITGSPLVVMDGVQVGDLNSINPDDIESISVIKDAASAAIYGSNAPYGVILITTKQGTKNKQPTLSYNNNLSTISPINLPSMVNSLDFANLYNEASINAGQGVLFDEETIGRIKSYQAGIMDDETIVNPNVPNQWYHWNKSNANNDWFDIYFKDKAFTQQHNFGLNGGNENSTYYVGLGYHDREGMFNYGDEKFQRYNVRANLSSDINEIVRMNLRTSFSREHYDAPNTLESLTAGYMHHIARRWPTVPLYNPDGRLSNLSGITYQTDGGRTKSTEDQLILTGELVFNLAKNWNITSNYSVDNISNKASAHSKTLFNYWPDGSVTLTGIVPNKFEQSSIENEHHVLNLFSTYDLTIGNHNITGLIGYVRDRYNYEFISAENTDLYSNDLPALSLTFSTSPTVSDELRKLTTEGYFSRLKYNYQEKYLIEVNGRYDGSSRFLRDDRWRFYPGVSAGWVVSNEDFWNNAISETINFFKLRASYGSLGDQSFLGSNYYPFYPSLGTIPPNNSSWLFGGERFASVEPPELINPNLTWITTTSVNFGLDISLFENRIQGNFDWYIRNAKDFAGPSEALPAVLGVEPPLTNNAAMETRGFELSLSWRDKIGDLEYNIRGVLSDFKGKVVKYPNPNNILSTWYEGQNMGEIWGYSTHGLFSDEIEVEQAASQNRIFGGNWTAGDVRYVDINGDGTVDFGNNTVDNPGDRRIIGNNTPRYSFGVTLGANWKGFDAEVFVQGIGKRDYWFNSLSNYFWGMVGNQWQSSPFTVHLEDRWTPDTPDGYFPKYYMSNENLKNTEAQTRYLQNASYVRIKNLQIGYSIQPSLINKIGFQRLRFYISADNLATFTQLIDTIDPELAMGSNRSGGKIYPLQRFTSIGVNITF